MELIIIALAKILDSLLTTSKSILTHKGKALSSSVLIFLSQLIFYFLISKIIKDNTVLSILTVSLSAGVGSYLAFMINNKFSKEVLYINIVTSNNKDDMKSLCEYLKENKVKNIIYDSYTKDWARTYAVQVLANTKAQSILLDKFIEISDGKYLREIVN